MFDERNMFNCVPPPLASSIVVSFLLFTHRQQQIRFYGIQYFNVTIWVDQREVFNFKLNWMSEEIWNVNYYCFFETITPLQIPMFVNWPLICWLASKLPEMTTFKEMYRWKLFLGNLIRRQQNEPRFCWIFFPTKHDHLHRQFVFS